MGWQTFRGAHALNYLKDYSTTVFSDPVALRQAILGKAATEYIHAVRVLLLLLPAVQVKVR